MLAAFPQDIRDLVRAFVVEMQPCLAKCGSCGNTLLYLDQHMHMRTLNTYFLLDGVFVCELCRKQSKGDLTYYRKMV